MSEGYATMIRSDAMIEYAKSMLGTPYIWGGSNALLGFDCSGFVQEVLASIGADPLGDQTAQTLFNHFSKSIQKEPQKGSLLFFGKDQKRITHIAIALGDGQMIEAGGGGSSTKTRADAEKTGACVRIRPIENRSDLVAITTIL
jgi:cell wall-associated NlpC family hydrolase